MNELDKLIHLLEKEVEIGSFPGANFSVVFPNKCFMGSVGYFSLEPEKVENSIDTIYDMASLSKVISTTTLVYKAFEEGLIRKDMKVSKILPRFRHDDITIYHLLTHTSGLPEGISGVLKLKTKDDVINKIYEMPLVYETGTSIRYSDVGYILLGFILEKIFNKSLDVLAREYVFEPLEMIDTSYNPKDIDRCAPTEVRDDDYFKGVIKGFVHDETAHILGGISGNAGVFSTVKDVTNFIQMILNDGVFNEKEILSKASIDLMFKPFVSEKNGVNLTGVTRGLGWLIGGMYSPSGDLTSENTIHHTGFTGTSLWIDRTNKIGFCLLSNRVHPTRNNLLHIEARGKISNYVMSNIDKIK